MTSELSRGSEVEAVTTEEGGGCLIPCRAAVAAVDKLIFLPPPISYGSLAVRSPSSYQIVAHRQGGGRATGRQHGRGGLGTGGGENEFCASNCAVTVVADLRGVCGATPPPLPA